MNWSMSALARAVAHEAAAALARSPPHRPRRDRYRLRVATVVTALAIAEGAQVAAVDEIGARHRQRFPSATSPVPVLSLGDVRAIHDALGPNRIVAAARSVALEIRTDERRAPGFSLGHRVVER